MAGLPPSPAVGAGEALQVIFIAALRGPQDAHPGLHVRLAPILAVLGLIGALIAKEDLGTAVSLIGTGLAMTYLAGARKSPGHCWAWRVRWRSSDSSPRRNTASNACSRSSIPGTTTTERATSRHTPRGAGIRWARQVKESRARQKFLYLPAEHTDYIFATVGEEMGLVGSVLLLIGFAFLVGRGLSIAHRTKDRFGSLLAAGLTSMLGVQALLNIAVVTASVPATGVPLPFISYGGSSPCSRCSRSGSY